MKLDPAFFEGVNPSNIAKSLLGKVLCSEIGGELSSGIIVETEAYQGPEDRGSHAFSGRRTPRTEVMFGPPGHIYVYLCYGIHNLLNIITGPRDVPHAVLIRALQPLLGTDVMNRRRVGKSTLNLANGPGLVCSAMGINLSHNGLPINGNAVWIEEAPIIPQPEIIASPRVGMNFDGPWKSVLYRFRIQGNPYTSRPV